MRMRGWSPPGSREPHTHFDFLPQRHAVAGKCDNDYGAAASQDPVAFLKCFAGILDNVDQIRHEDAIESFGRKRRLHAVLFLDRNLRTLTKA